MAKAKLNKDDVKEYIKNMPVFDLAKTLPHSIVIGQ